MLFVSRQIRDKVGVVDTDDWSEEVIDIARLHKLMILGLSIEDSKVQTNIIYFFKLYSGVISEIGSGSTLDMVDKYLNGVLNYSDISYEFGSSTGELIRYAKDAYTNLRKKWSDFDICNFGKRNDLLDLIHNCMSADTSSLKKYKSVIHRRYHIDNEVLEEMF